MSLLALCLTVGLLLFSLVKMFAPGSTVKGVVASGIFAVIFAVALVFVIKNWLLNDRVYLELDVEGFTVSGWSRQACWKWEDIEGFYVMPVSTGESTSDYLHVKMLSHYVERRLRERSLADQYAVKLSRTQRDAEFFKKLPVNFGLTMDEEADLLDLHLQAYRKRQAASAET